MTREEADIAYKKVRERLAQSRDQGVAEGRGDRGDRGDGDDRVGIRFNGTITAIGRGSITVAHERRGEITVVATDRTKITRNGERARLADLQVRDGVAVAGTADRTRDGVVITARSIDARGR